MERGTEFAIRIQERNQKGDVWRIPYKKSFLKCFSPQIGTESLAGALAQSTALPHLNLSYVAEYVAGILILCNII